MVCSLLVPYKHYIPVQYLPNVWPLDGGINLAAMVTWAEENPEWVGNIVREARAFARLHLSRRGQLCFWVRLLQRYHELLTGLDALEALMEEADHQWLEYNESMHTPPPGPPPPPSPTVVHAVMHRIQHHVLPRFSSG